MTATSTIYFEGGAGRGKHPAWATCVISNGVSTSLFGEFQGDPAGAEIQAALAGLKVLPAGGRVLLVSTGTTVAKGLTEWRKSWQRRGWKTSSGAPIANLDLWLSLFELADRHSKISVRHAHGADIDEFTKSCLAQKNGQGGVHINLQSSDGHQAAAA